LKSGDSFDLLLCFGIICGSIYNSSMQGCRKSR